MHRTDASYKDDGEVEVGEAAPLFDLTLDPVLAELSAAEVITEPEPPKPPPKRRGRPPGSKNKPKDYVPPPKPAPPPPKVDASTPPLIATALVNSEELTPLSAEALALTELIDPLAEEVARELANDPPAPSPPSSSPEPEPVMSTVIAPKPFDGIPFDAIRELMGTHGKVHVRLSRKDARGKYAVMGTHEMTPAELSDIESFLEEVAGGGEYEILVRSAADRTQVLLRFAFKLEGPPKPYAEIIARAAAEASGGPRGVFPMGAGTAPMIGTDEWAEHAGASVGGVRFTSAPFVDPYGRRSAPASPNGTLRDRPAPGATMSSDELALDMFRRLEQQHAELQRNYQRLAQQKLEDDRKAEREASALREKNREEAFQRQLDMMRLELKASNGGGGSKGLDLGGVAAIIGAVAPIVTGLMSANANAASQAAQLQTQGMKTLMDATLAQASKPSEMEKLVGLIQTFGPLVLPHVKEFLAKKDDPEAQVKLITAMAEGQLNQISMAAQLIEQFASDRIPAEHPAIPIIKQLIEGGMQTAQAYFAEKNGVQALPQGAVPAGAIEAGEEPEVVPAPAPAPAPRPRAVPPPRRPAPATTNSANGHPPDTSHPMLALLPTAFKTPQWMKLLETVHQDPPPPAEQMGEVLGFHLMHCMLFNNMPTELAELQAKPRETLALMFSFLPVNTSNPDYVKSVIEKAISFLRASNQIAAEEPKPVPPKAAPAASHRAVRAKVPPTVVATVEDPAEEVEESGETELEGDDSSEEDTPSA